MNVNLLYFKGRTWAKGVREMGVQEARRYGKASKMLERILHLVLLSTMLLGCEV
jgi:hypothetical protein